MDNFNNIRKERHNFECLSPITTTNNLNKRVQILLKTLSNYSEDSRICDMNLNDLENILNHLDKMSLSIRSAMEDHNYSDEDIEYLINSLEQGTNKRFKHAVNNNKNIENSTLLDEYFETNLPVYINYEENKLHIFIPYTFRRSYKDCYVLAQYVKAKLLLWTNTHRQINIKMPCTMIVMRRTGRFDYNLYCDNDNFEIRKITNSILTGVFGSTDACCVMDYISLYEVVHDDKQKGVHIYIVPHVNFNEICTDFIPKSNENFDHSCANFMSEKHFKDIDNKKKKQLERNKKQYEDLKLTSF